MSKKQILILALIFVLAIILTFGYFYVRSKSAGQNGANSGQTGFDSFFPVPDGASGTGQGTPGYNGQSEYSDPSQITDPAVMPRLRILSIEPVAGYTAFQVLASTTLPTDSIVGIATAGSTTTLATTTLERRNLVRYVLRASGNIFEARDNTLSQERVTNTTIPKVYEAFFTASTSPVFRYLQDEAIATYRATINELTDAAQGVFLQSDISEITPSPNGDRLAKLLRIGNQINLSIQPLATNAAERTIFSSFSTQWKMQWPSPTRLFLTSKADSRYPGLIYSINPQTGASDIVLSEYNGLTSLFNASGTKAFVSYAGTLQTESAIFSITENTILPLSVTTLAEKCVWSTLQDQVVFCAIPQETLGLGMPQSWYQGASTFTDSVYRIDAVTGNTSLVIGGSELEGNLIDMTHLSLSQDEKFIYFINKKDLTLWSYQLNASDIRADQ